MKKNGLKALMLTDWYTMKVVYICIIVIEVCGGVMSLTFTAATGGASPSFTMFFNAMSALLLPTVFAYDEIKNIGVMKKTMPYTDRQIVLARYLPPAIIAATSILLILLGTLIGGAIHGSYAEFFGRQLAFSVWMTSLYTLLIPTLFYPLFYTFGYRRTMTFFSIFAVIIMMSSMIFFFLGPIFITADEVRDDAGNLVDKSAVMAIPVPAGIILTAVMAGLYYLSYRISVKKYALSDN